MLCDIGGRSRRRQGRHVDDPALTVKGTALSPKQVLSQTSRLVDQIRNSCNNNKWWKIGKKTFSVKKKGLSRLQLFQS